MQTALEPTFGQVFNKGGGTTAYDRALRWIADDDPRQLSTTAPNLVQRYVMALFYYQTSNNGNKKWRSCNPPGVVGSGGENDIDVDDDSKCILYEFMRLSDDEIEYVPQTGRTRWLSGKDECAWEGVRCDSSSFTNEVNGIELRKSALRRFVKLIPNCSLLCVCAHQFLKSI